MNVWLLLLVCIFLTRVLINKSVTDRKKSDKAFLIISGIMIVFVMGSRYATATGSGDINNYYRMYINAANMSWKGCFESENIEWGYLLLNKILVKIVKWPQFIMYLEASFVTFFMLRAIYKYSDNVFLGLMCYFSVGTFIFALTGFRQSIAFSICLYAVDFLINKKHIRFIILVLLAMTIHQTAVVFFSVLLFTKAEMKRNYIFMLIVLIIGLSFTADKLMSLGNDVFEREYLTEFKGNLKGGLINISIYSFAVFMYILNDYKNLKNIDRIGMIFIYIGIMGIGLYIMRFKSLVIERISLYFLEVIPILMSNGLARMRVKHRNDRLRVVLFSYACLILLFIYRVYTTIGMNYRFFWQTGIT